MMPRDERGFRPYQTSKARKKRRFPHVMEGMFIARAVLAVSACRSSTTPLGIHVDLTFLDTTVTSTYRHYHYLIDMALRSFVNTITYRIVVDVIPFHPI